jgi:hypothetical protein
MSHLWQVKTCFLWNTALSVGRKTNTRYTTYFMIPFQCFRFLTHLRFPNSQFHDSISVVPIALLHCRANLSNCVVYIYTRIASHMDNYMLRVLESANQTTSISAQTMEQQKILYTHKHCEIIHIKNVRFLFPFFSINHTEPQQRVAGYG